MLVVGGHVSHAQWPRHTVMWFLLFYFELKVSDLPKLFVKAELVSK
jgi:hypothetical protein